MPTPLVSKLVPGFSPETKAKYDAIRNIGVVCVLFKLAKPVTRHFWLNVNDTRIDIPGIVEFSNLRPLPNTVVYVPYYMPQSHPKFARDAAVFVAEAFGTSSTLIRRSPIKICCRAKSADFATPSQSASPASWLRFRA